MGRILDGRDLRRALRRNRRGWLVRAVSYRYNDINEVKR